MATELKLAVGYPKAKRTYKFELKGPDAEKLVGKKIGEKFNGAVIGATGYELEITGGSDKSGFPMVKSIAGGARKTPLLAGGTGFNPKRKGQRRRKTVVGNTISDRISQVNCKIVKEGKEDLEKVLGISPKEEAKSDGEKPAEEPAETPKEESKSEKKTADEEKKE